jgi:carbon storage regulator|tara:strand:- start:192 stop:368 length:177 start_codon:yes stop_codon:yes gene_type:complete
MENNMLVLTRKVGQKVMIGDNIEVTILAINGGQIKVGIAAPKSVDVDREEIRKRKQGE